MKKNNGITLIALIITIVVLIILASVAITLSLGDNGIFRKAAKAKEDTLIAQNEESMQIAETTNSIDEIVGSSDRATTTESKSISKTVLFSGKADTAKTEYTLIDSIENYSMLVVYASLSGTTATSNNNACSIVIDPDEVDYANDGDNKYVIGTQVIYSSNGYVIRFKFTTNNKFKIYDKSMTGWTASEVNYRIYRIVGIK